MPENEPSTDKTPQKNSTIIQQALGNIRSELLDLSARNPLLNNRYNRGKKFIQIVDELPGQIADKLLNGSTLKFAPIPELKPRALKAWQLKHETETEPTVEELARIANINLDLELPHTQECDLAKHHADRELQTKYLVSEMESRLSKIRSLADSCIQETGLNTLYLVLGHLDWIEAKSSKDARSAPLFTIPVTLKKGNLDPKSQTYIYTIEHSGEDLIANASLAARLSRDFDYQLPNIPEDDNVDSYFEAIESSIKIKFPEWQVRRNATVTFLNFGKLLMFQDLDPERWPAEKSLESNSLVQSIIMGGSSGNQNASSDANFTGEYDIDAIEDVHMDFPLVDSADSSQHSAVIDAVKGKNLVIEGPPGAGKSQTITNLIAASIESGKTVLFVSEKMAALEVVKKRLSKLGLGDFCLELHSHATKKMGVLDSLKSRLELEATDNEDTLNSVIASNNKQRATLTKHAELMNEEWNHTGLSIHAIFSASTRERQHLPAALLKSVNSDLSCADWSQNKRELAYRSAKTLHAAVCRIYGEGDLNHPQQQHPWYGVTSASLNSSDEESVTSLLAEWTAKLIEIQQHIQQLTEGSESSEVESLQNLHSLVTDISALPENHLDLSWDGLGWALQSNANRLKLKHLINQNKAIKELLNVTDPPLTSDQLDSVGPLGSLDFFNDLKAAKVHDSYTLGEFSELAELLAALAEFAERSLPFIEEFEKGNLNHPTPALQSPTVTLSDIRSITVAAELLDALSDSALGDRSLELIEEENLKLLKDLPSTLDALQTREETLKKTFTLPVLKTAENLRKYARTLSESGLLTQLFNTEYKLAKKEILALLQQGKSGFNADKISAQLEELAKHIESIDQFEQRTHQLSRPLTMLEDWRNCSADELSRFGLFHQWIFDHLTTTTGGLFSQLTLSDFAEWLCQSSIQEVKMLTSFKKVGLGDMYAVAHENLQRIKTQLPEVVAIQDIESLPLRDFASNSGPVGWLKNVAHEGAGLLSHPLAKKSVSVATAITISKTIVKALASTSSVLAEVSRLNKECFNNSLTPTQKGISHSLKVIEATLDWSLHLTSTSHNEASLLSEKFASEGSAEYLVKLQQWQLTSASLLDQEAQKSYHFSKTVALDKAAWNDGSDQLSMIIARNQRALTASADFVNYALFLNAQSEFVERTSETLAEAVLSENISEAETISAVRYFIKKSLSKQIIDSHPELQKFLGVKHEQVQREFKKSDTRLLNLQRERIRNNAIRRHVPPGVRGAKVSDYTDLCLVQHETNKQKRHIPIRQLLNRGGAAIQALKPCFMMGPRSVAQYLEPGGLEFDLLVIDEASQLKPSEALGATARAKQLVVVGDPKQLPPTSFFDRNTSSDEEDEDELALVASESILEAALPIFTARRLRWHYRSRHESLIAFSNQNFYNNNLLIFPSPVKANEELGIKYIYMDQGCFKAQQNVVEARAIAKRLETLLIENAEASVGIATMNMKQRELIEAHIEILTKENPLFDEAVSKNKALFEPYFVKNLETVQGDERDVILISCTYGPAEPGGRVFQRFGPINSDVGWRRLNVLFTRSRCRMEVFSSMRSTDILASSGSRGVKAFRGFLHYAESGHLHVPLATGNPADSDFEIAVSEMLAQHGYECDYQIGVAGFFIDLAVKHPHQEGKYILAVECDGATYHSSKSARDRDCLRQEILESLGWNIERIWSTDWFNNPQAALQPVLQELKKLLE